jgi:ABC-2 type transport system permease protein
MPALPDRVRALPVAAAFLRRSLYESTSQLTPTVLQLASIAMGLLSQAFLGRMVDAAPNPALGAFTGHYAAFLLLGICLLDLQGAVVGGLSRQIRDGQLFGWLEALLVTPAPTPLVLLGLVLPDVLGSFARLMVYAIVGRFLFGLDFGAADPLGTAVMLAASLAAFAAFALIGAAITMTVRRADPLNLLLASAGAVAGGVFYPRGMLPGWLEPIGAWLPIAPALDGLRAAVVHGAGPAELAVPLGRLLALVAVVGPLGAWLFTRSLARARRDGSLTAY